MATCEYCDQWIVHDMDYHLAHCDKARIAKLTAELDAHKAALRLAMAMYAGLSLDSEQAKCDAEIAAILGGSHPLIAERDYLKCLERARAWVDANVDARLMDAYDAAVYGDEAKARALLEAGNE